ncbi:hypothetical protein ACE193_10775 [Bernardetia sp. OM2101]|uniref:hypothetical protein n=1 Tax=Bernardetia sp. OM2101 TaxID=3344876 RepID=UPI0035CF3CED
MNLNKFKKFALTTKKAQQITGGNYAICYDAETGFNIIVPLSEVSNYPPNHCMIPAG